MGGKLLPEACADMQLPRARADGAGSGRQQPGHFVEGREDTKREFAKLWEINVIVRAMVLKWAFLEGTFTRCLYSISFPLQLQCPKGLKCIFCSLCCSQQLLVLHPVFQRCYSDNMRFFSQGARFSFSFSCPSTALPCLEGN